MSGDTPESGASGMRSFVLYADGASRGNPGPASIGGLVMSGDGVVLHEVSQRIGIATNNVAEWRAAIAVLEAARTLGAETVELRMDSELVVRQLTGRYKVRNPNLLPLYQQALALTKAFTRFAAGHVPRALNAHADRLANAALDARPGT